MKKPVFGAGAGARGGVQPGKTQTGLLIAFLFTLLSN